MSTIDIFKIQKVKDNQPIIPVTYLYLSSFAKDDNNNILLSPQLMSDNEIDDFVDSLIRQLEKKRKEAKKEIGRQKRIILDQMK